MVKKDKIEIIGNRVIEIGITGEDFI